jgi:energy-coupling factor transport system substrate-specific component
VTSQYAKILISYKSTGLPNYLLNKILTMRKKARRQEANQVLIAGFAVFLGMTTGVLWTYGNPFQLVPGIIQWRTFAFLPPVIGILISPTAGFVSGYIGAVVWSLLASTFIPVHTLIVDGVMSGVTGLIPAMTTGRKFTLAQMANDPRAMVHAAIMAAGATVLMVVANAASFAVMKIYPFWWSLLWIGLSMLIPVLLGTPIAMRYGSRMIQARQWIPTVRLRKKRY